MQIPRSAALFGGEDKDLMVLREVTDTSSLGYGNSAAVFIKRWLLLLCWAE